MEAHLSKARAVFSSLLAETGEGAQVLQDATAQVRNDAFDKAWATWTGRFFPERASRPNADRRIGDMVWATFHKHLMKWRKEHP